MSDDRDLDQFADEINTLMGADSPWQGGMPVSHTPRP